jgi:hypothetical protein
VKPEPPVALLLPAPKEPLLLLLQGWCHGVMEEQTLPCAAWSEEGEHLAAGLLGHTGHAQPTVLSPPNGGHHLLPRAATKTRLLL